MQYYFWDSSAVAKRYIYEQGTRWIRSIANHPFENAIFVAPISAVEVVSAVMRRQRNGEIGRDHAYKMRRLIDKHFDERYLPMHLSLELLQTAEDLLERHPLRGYDAVQLASALEAHNTVFAATHDPVIFLSADGRLLDAATAEGLPTENPDQYE